MRQPVQRDLDASNSSAGECIWLAYEDQPHVRFSGTMTNLSSSAVRLWLSKPLIVDARVRLELSRGCHQAGTVLYCKPDGNGFVVSISLPSEGGPVAGNRKEERTELVETVTVTVMDGPEHTAWGAVTTDISPSGLGLRTPRAVATGLLVRVELPAVVLFGEVRYCRAVGNDYRVGLLVERRVERSAEPSRGLRTRLLAIIRRAVGRNTAHE